MFCFQCEQTANGRGCDRFGVCGKGPDVAALQDLLIFETMQIGRWARKLNQLGVRDEDADRFVIEALFTTVTNVNFDAESIEERINAAVREKARLFDLYGRECAKGGGVPESVSAGLSPGTALQRGDLIREGEKVSPRADIEKYGPDLGGLKWLAVYGLKGAAAYADHAMLLGKTDQSVFSFFHEALAQLADETITVDGMLALNLKIGEVNLRVMELLDAGNTGAYGHPEPTSVRTTPLKGKAILVSGHDLIDLELLLKQTEGKGVLVYTHGEMLPCGAYPGLKKYKHLAGNFGGAWQDQQREFAEFPGAVLMTTNCIQKPTAYAENIFTSGLVRWPGVRHIGNRDFSPVIEQALSMPGFTEDAPEKKITIGFARSSILNAAERVVDLVKTGRIRRLFLIGGCDGAKTGRNYYTEFAELAPKDTVILTLACGKYRFNKLEFGDIDGIPRLLDCGQCNDAYSAIQVAAALAKAFETDVNGLPLSFILSWYEQKAVAILLTLLHMGIRNIRLGPSLPAFIGPEVLNVLAEKFNIMPIATAESDLRAILG